MAITKQQENKLYVKLADMVGADEAEFLMSQGPPGGWDKIATKADLNKLAAKMVGGFLASEAGFIEVHTQLDRLEGKAEAGFATAVAKRDQLEAKMVAGFAETNARVDRLEATTEAGFAKTNARIDRNEGKTEAGFTKTEAGFTEVHARIDSLEAKTEAGFIATDAKIDQLEAKMVAGFAALASTRSRDVWAFTAAIAVLVISVMVAVFLGGAA